MAVDAFTMIKVQKRWITRLHLYVGAPGAGKTTAALNSYPDLVYNKDNKTRWWEGYQPRLHRAAVINEFHQTDYFNIDLLLSLCDRVRNNIEIKGSSTVFLCTDLYITTNEVDPTKWFSQQYDDQKWAAFWRKESIHIESIVV